MHRKLNRTAVGLTGPSLAGSARSSQNHARLGPVSIEPCVRSGTKRGLAVDETAPRTALMGRRGHLFVHQQMDQARGVPAAAAALLHLGIELIHQRSEEHTSELQSLMRISYAVSCLKKTKTHSKPFMSN